MNNYNTDKLVISGAPLIGEGNIVDVKSLIATLKKDGIPGTSFYPNGLMVILARLFHTRMSMNTDITMDYAFNSDKKRSSFLVFPLKLELKRTLKRMLKDYPGAACFITSQNMIAEESVGRIGSIPTLIVSSDVCGKFSNRSSLSRGNHNIIHLVWNIEAFNVYKHKLNLQNVHLINPLDPIDAFNYIERGQLPFQNALEDPNVCFIKLSGSGGDPALINSVIFSLWEKSRVKSIVFPGLAKTQKKLLKSVGSKIKVNTSLDTGVFYNQAREIISGQHMFLLYPSEQVKHISILANNNIFPKIAWLPPRGEHEVINLSWAIKHGFSGTICIPAEFHGRLKDKLTGLGVSPSEIEFIVPEKLSAEHFRQSPVWRYDEEAVTLASIVRKLTGIN
ncbi:MAG: hypothetical protein ABFR82_11420 [Nitrospirota bacterium]